MGATYSSAREDRDYLLDYKSIDTSSLETIDLFQVPVSNVSRDEAVAAVMNMIEEKKGPHYVFFADPIKLMQIRPKRKLAFLAQKFDLILADGAGLQWAAERTGSTLKERIPMIATIMDLIRLAVKQEYTIYLLGSKMEYLEKVFLNLSRSFPGVRIVGRQGGHFTPERGRMIKESLRKSAPDLLFVGMGFPYQDLWIEENKEYLGKTVVVSVDGALDILSGQEKKAPDSFQLNGKTWLWRTITRPLNFVRMYYMISFFVKGFFRKNT